MTEKKNLKVVKCEKCDVVVFKQKEELKFGDALTDDKIDSMQGHVIGNLTSCKQCHYMFNLADPSIWDYE